jgi:membrane protein YdbS with pleckstrin-like domain
MGRMDTPMRLKNVTLFAALPGDDLARIGEITARNHFTPGIFLCQQGERGETLYILDSGEAIENRVGLPTAEGAVTHLHEGDSFGEEALVLGDLYCSSVQAVTDVEALSIHKQDFDRLLKQYPHIGERLQPSRLVTERLRAPRFPWQDKDEPTLLLRKRHWFAFVRSLPVPLLILAALSIAAWLLGQAGIPMGIARTLLFVGLVPSILVLWFYLDWQNDFYLVTTKRILHEERVILLYQTWDEVPLNKVQSTTVKYGFLGKMLGFGTLAIQTASLRGTMVLDHLPDPEDVQEVICRQTSQLGSVVHQDEREEIREELRRQLVQIGLEVELPAPAFVPPPEQLRSRVTPVAQLLQLRFKEGDRITWRKHWVFLLRKASLPLIVFLATTALVALSLLRVPTSYRFAVFLASLVIWVASLIWLWWRVEDWGNDLYIVTDRLIIDIERKPLFFSEERRQATFDMIQNVSLRKEGFLPALLNYGDVVIQTAGALGELTFAGVSDPIGVQREIFRRVDEYHEASRRHERKQERTEISKWFREYHEMRQPPQSGDS